MGDSSAGERDQESRNLIKRLRNQQPQALVELYNSYAELLYVLVKGIVHDPAIVDSLVQESFLRAWNRTGQLEETFPSIASWLVGIGRECALDHVKISQAPLHLEVVDRHRPFPIGAVKFQHFSVEHTVND
jgi:DNA-directed RNA polymerase specialized sigma24 family protein